MLAGADLSGRLAAFGGFELASVVFSRLSRASFIPLRSPGARESAHRDPLDRTELDR